MPNMWVVDMEKEVDGVEPPATVQKWPKHCIFRVPAHFKAVSGNGVFKPQMVALGPFHHKDDALRPMEEHKLRAVRHLLRRAGKTLGDLATAVERVAGDLEDAYAELGDEWRGENRDKFLQMMIADGCFLLEFMRNSTREMRREETCDYSLNDPVFGPHAVVHIGFFVLRDMLLMENQLPLILLRTIVTVETGQTPIDSSINKLVLHFLCNFGTATQIDSSKPTPSVGSRLGLHPLDLYRRSRLQRRSSQEQPNPSHRCCLPRDSAAPEAPIDDDDEPEKAAPRSAQKLYEAGIWFKRRETDYYCLNNIEFKKMNCNTLEMPRVFLDDSSEYKYRNLMAFEALHDAGAGGAGGNDVTAFVLFMRDLVDSTDDVELLRKRGILDHDLAGGDREVVSLLNRLTGDVAKIGRSRLCGIRRDMERYCVSKSWVWRVLICKSWANLRTSHLSSIWKCIALLAAIFLLCTDIVQTVFTVKGYYKNELAPPLPPHRGRWTVHY